MSPQSNEDIDKRRADLSALMDGDVSAADTGCRAWREDARARADWHLYHLIGDAMRSDEHRCDAARDAQLLARVRERLAAEPVVLAPAPLAAAPASPRRRARWMAPAAMAAGFAAVAGVVVVTRMASEPAGAELAARQGAAVVVATPAPSASGLPAEGAPMIRSAELDRYLAAHRQYATGGVQVAPGGVVRNAAATVPGR